ncbi:MAG: hypothetical protein MZV64_35085 [Ignavibacteriales bacterium]|nr:hypothetical protein [Ignavibacteriales bacterium]
MTSTRSRPSASRPEWMSEKALAIATYCVASGAYVIFGGASPVSGMPDRVADSDLVLKYISEGWEKQYGGKLEFIADPDEMIKKHAGTHRQETRRARPARMGAEQVRSKRRCEDERAWRALPLGEASAKPSYGAGGRTRRLTMSKYIATRAMRGANALVTEAEIMLNKASGRKRRRHPCFVPQHGVLPAHHPRHDRHSRRKTRRPGTRPAIRPRTCSTRSLRSQALDALPRRDARLGHGHPARGGDHRSRALRLWTSA